MNIHGTTCLLLGTTSDGPKPLIVFSMYNLYIAYTSETHFINGFWQLIFMGIKNELYRLYRSYLIIRINSLGSTTYCQPVQPRVAA